MKQTLLCLTLTGIILAAPVHAGVALEDIAGSSAEYVDKRISVEGFAACPECYQIDNGGCSGAVCTGDLVVQKEESGGPSLPVFGRYNGNRVACESDGCDLKSTPLDLGGKYRIFGEIRATLSKDPAKAYALAIDSFVVLDNNGESSNGQAHAGQRVEIGTGIDRTVFAFTGPQGGTWFRVKTVSVRKDANEPPDVVARGTFSGGLSGGLQDGEWTAYGENGKIRWHGFFVRGAKHGQWSEYDSAGTLTNKGPFVSGRETGIWETPATGKLPRATTNYRDPQTAVESIYDAKGTVYATADVNRFTQVVEGMRLTYPAGGAKKTVSINLKTGDARIRELFTNGKTAFSLSARGGLFVDSLWYESGRLWETVSRDMNGARRAFSEWRPNGALLWKGDFVGFRPHGTWTRFDTAGAVLQTINYDHGAIVKSASDSSGRASEGSAAYSVEPVTGLGAVKALCADAGCVWVGAKSGAFHFTEKAVVDKHYTTANGLPGNSVSALAIDGSGGTWFGVEQSAIDEVPSGGACCITVMGTPLAKLSSENGEISGGQALGRTYDTRYAVAAFVNNKWRYYDSVGDASYVPPVNRIVCVKGETWFGSLNGMRRTGNTPNATVAARLSNCTGPIAESPDGTVWGAAFDTLYKIAGDSLTAYGLGASRRDITALATDPHGQLFALSSTAIRSFDSGAFKDVCGLGEYAVLPNSSLIVEPEGSFVFASDKGLVRCGSKERTVIVPGSKLDKQTISCFARGANEYWIGTPSGLYRASSNTVAPCATPVGPPARYASLCCAGPGKLVHAYFNGIGMYRWNGVAWKLFDSTAFGEVNSMVALRDSTVFVGADAGLFLLKGNSTLNLGLHNTLASGKVTVTSLDGAGGLFYVLDKFRVVHAGSNAFAVVHEQTPVIDGEITALFSDATSRLWIADRNGISVFVRDSLIRSYSASSGLPLFPITQVFQSGDGTMYARSIESVFRLEGDRWNSIGTQDNINGAVISKIAEDRRGNLWVGTKDGLCLFEKGRQGFRQIRNGLLDKEVNDLAVAGDGSLWVATDKGLSRVTER